MIYASYDMLLCKDAFFGGCVDTAAHLKNQITRNPQFWDVIRHLQTKHVKYSSFHNIKTTAWIPAKFCPMIKTSKYSVCGPKVHPTNPRWQTAAILKNYKITISPQLFDWFWRNSAWWCIWTLRNWPTIKICGVLWYKMVEIYQIFTFQDGGHPISCYF